ncbi:hypothetical protein MKX57_01600 [Lysinibacillus sp. FSL M8-0216]|uniref:hypothetical protein n=1 Tax=Lysinibacillus sp. FSL M8-0216 TaxID=2921619 RepID=UPI00315A382C
MAPLTFTSVTTDQISSETVAETSETKENVARLIFPINGIGDVKIEGTNYHIKKGRIPHVGPNFPSRFLAVNEAKLEYVVIYFHLSDEEQAKLPLYNSHFPLQVVEHMKLMNIVQQLIATNQKGSSFIISSIQSTLFKYFRGNNFIDEGERLSKHSIHFDVYKKILQRILL